MGHRLAGQHVSKGNLITRVLVGLVGTFLLVIGVVHAVVNARGIGRAIARSEIRESLGSAMVANAVVSGAALTFLGVILLVCARDLRSANRTAWSISFLIGLFLVACGIAGYAWRPDEHVLVFSLAGALVLVPLLIWRRASTTS